MVNMAAKLTECTKEQRRPVIRFLCSENVKTGGIYERMSIKYGDNSMSQRKVYE